MANKKCMVFETLNSVQTLSVQRIDESKASDGLIRMSGVFGVCGVKNGNNRIYDKENYRLMVEALQKQILNEGVPGELEHPNTMNIDLNNISHKIESIEMNEDGTITGTIVLLNTDKGKNAQAIVEGGLPLYISSRGAGSIDESGHVTLSTIKTYDLVGTPGFAQAKLDLKKGQKFESLNESLEDGPISWMIVEGEDLLDGGDGEGNGDGDNNKEPEKKEPEKKEPEKKDDTSSDNGNNNDDDANKTDDNKNSQDTTMNDLKEAIDKLTEKVTNLEAELHVAQESLTAKDAEIATLNETLATVNTTVGNIEVKVNDFKATDYAGIQTWVTEHFAPEFKEEMSESIIESACEKSQAWTVETFAPYVQGWIMEEFSPEVQNWVVEEFAPEVQNWVVEEFAPEVQGWVCEEFAPTVEGWIMEEFTPETTNNISESVDSKITAIENKVNENVAAYMESQKTSKLDTIDALLESMENGKDAALELLKEQKAADKYAGVYAIENMPAQYQPSWNTLNEAKKDEIVRQSRAYDFTKTGVLESFWAGVQFTNAPVNENKDVNPIANYQSAIAAQMLRLRNKAL